MTLSIVVGGRRALNQEVHKKNQEVSSCMQVKHQVAIASRLNDLSTYRRIKKKTVSIYVMTANMAKSTASKLI